MVLMFSDNFSVTRTRRKTYSKLTHKQVNKHYLLLRRWRSKTCLLIFFFFFFSIAEDETNWNVCWPKKYLSLVVTARVVYIFFLQISSANFWTSWHRLQTWMTHLPNYTSWTQFFQRKMFSWLIFTNSLKSLSLFPLMSALSAGLKLCWLTTLWHIWKCWSHHPCDASIQGWGAVLFSVCQDVLLVCHQSCCSLTLLDIFQILTEAL